MAFELSDEKAIDVLIWWIEGSDGSIDYSEKEAVREIMDDMDYSIETFYQETLQHIGALGNEEIKELVEESIQWAARNFSDHKKKVTLALLSVIAESTGDISDDEKEKINRLEREFGVDNPKEIGKS